MSSYYIVPSLSLSPLPMKILNPNLNCKSLTSQIARWNSFIVQLNKYETSFIQLTENGLATANSPPTQLSSPVTNPTVQLL